MTQGPKDQNHEHHPHAFPEAIILHHGRSLFSAMTRWKQNHRIPPVLLLTGQSGIGKKAMARKVAQWLLCDTPLTGDHPSACQACPSCQSFLARQHTAYTEINPDEDSESLKIEQFRELKSTVGFGTYQHHTRVILIAQAERMTPQAANSMLKLLEETPSGWQFLLTTHDSTLLLPTLVSRCQTVKLKPLPVNEIQELLIERGLDSVRAQVCAELSQGSWDRALRLGQDEFWEKRKEVIKFLDSPHLQMNSLLDWATQKPSHFETLVDLLEQLTVDLLNWSSHVPLPTPEHYPWKARDAGRELSAHARSQTQRQGSPAMARQFWLDRAERLAQSRHEAHLPVNRKALAQDVLFPWMGVRI